MNNAQFIFEINLVWNYPEMINSVCMDSITFWILEIYFQKQISIEYDLRELYFHSSKKHTANKSSIEF